MQLAFLATVVSPKVASAAAQRALEFLASEDASTAALEDYLPPEEPSNGMPDAAAGSASEPASAASESKATAEEAAVSEPPAASEPASQAVPAQARVNTKDVKRDSTDQQGDAADSAAPVSNGKPSYASLLCVRMLATL